MLGLSEQIGRDERRIGGVVGNNEDFGRASGKVDADHAEELALGFGDVRVARARDQVDARHPHAAVRHRGHRLHAADAVDLVGARVVQRVERLRIDAIRSARWRGGDDALDARGLGRADTHDGGRDERILAAGDVAAGSRDRDQLLAEHDAGLQLDFERLQAVLLPLRELGHLLVAVGDVLLEGRRQRARDLVDARLRHPKLAGPLVEIARVFPHGFVAVLGDVGDHAADGGFDFGVARSGLHGGAFQIVASHGVLPGFVDCVLVLERDARWPTRGPGSRSQQRYP